MASEWDIDPTRMFACGSSAGAITVLQAEYVICNQSSLPARCGLPERFNYAGIIPMAGAICSDGVPEWKEKPCPMLLFHGDADAIVPFERATDGIFGLWGSKTISDGLSERGIPHRFHRVNGASHEIAGKPMTENCGEIYDFILRAGMSDVRGIENVVDYTPGMSDYKTDFSITDYINANL